MEIAGFVAAAIKFERDKERDSLHHAQQVKLYWERISSSIASAEPLPAL
jgi:hypothetical protein